MQAWLKVYHQRANLEQVRLLPLTLIGRSPDCHLKIASSQVSRRHCQVSLRPDGVYVEDLESANGTLLDGVRLPPRTLTYVRSGGRLEIGPAKFLVEYHLATPSGILQVGTPENPVSDGDVDMIDSEAELPTSAPVDDVSAAAVDAPDAPPENEPHLADSFPPLESNPAEHDPQAAAFDSADTLRGLPPAAEAVDVVTDDASADEAGTDNAGADAPWQPEGLPTVGDFAVSAEDEFAFEPDDSASAEAEVEVEEVAGDFEVEEEVEVGEELVDEADDAVDQGQDEFLIDIDVTDSAEPAPPASAKPANAEAKASKPAKTSFLGRLFGSRSQPKRPDQAQLAIEPDDILNGNDPAATPFVVPTPSESDPR